MSRCRVFLIDNHGVLRQSLRLLLETQADMVVVGDTGKGRGAVSAIAEVGGADVVVLDVSMPDVDGAAVAAELREALPQTKIVALTRHGEKAYIQQMMRSGATGYVLKQTWGDVLIQAIRTVANGGTFLDPAIAGKLIDPERVIGASATGDLSPREQEVLVMVAWGHSNKEIAATLGITVKTVETHKANGMKKLDISSRADLVRYALQQAWLTGPAS